MAQSDRKKNKYVLRGRVQTIAFFAEVVAVTAFLSVLLHRNFQRTIYRERQEMFSMVAHSAAHNFDREIKSEWEAYNLAYSIASDCAYEYGSIEECISAVNVKHDFGNDYYFFVDADGVYYSSDGVKGKIDEIDNYLKTSPDRVEYLSTLPHLNPRKTYMIYRGRFDQVMNMNSESGTVPVVFFAYAHDLTGLRNSVSGLLRQSCNIFINDRSGVMLYEEYGLAKVLDGNNVYKKFYRSDRPYGEDASDLEARAERGESVSVALNIKGKDYFFCTTPLSIHDWDLSLLLLPQEMDAGISHGLTGLILLMVAILLVIGLALVYFTYSSNMLRQEARLEESAKLMSAVEDASRAKTVFLSNMSHDIRTPINGIVGAATIARTAVDDPKRVSECLDKIDTASSHLLSLINDVLDMSRVESGRTTIKSEPVDIVELCKDTCVIINGQIGDRDVKFSLETDAEHPKVYADQMHLNRVFINILGNSVKFTRDGGRIVFRCRETACTDTDVTYRFEFIDTGIGMSKQFLEHIFDAFAQEENRERTKYAGTGLGMSITKQLVELMGGTIEVESEINKGSRFFVTITFKRDLEVREETAAPKAEESALADVSGVRVLLVEDNELNMEIAESLLTFNGVVVDKAWDGLEAVDKFTSKDIGTYDIILMDVMMPRMTGYEATKAIRSLNREDAATIPIVAMTANAFEDDVKATKEAGMNAHLIKPIDIDAVMKTIASLVRHNDAK